MSPSLLEQVVKSLEPNSQASISDKISTLQTFAATLNESLSLEESFQILNSVPLALFYNGFSVEDDQLTLILCQVINKLLSPFSFDQIMSEENKTFLLQGLSHFTPEIRYLSLQQVEKCLQSNDQISTMVNSDVFPLVLATIAFQDTKTANKASDILYNMSFKPAGQETYFGATCLSMLKQLLQINGVISFRVYDLIIKVATISDSTFEQSVSAGLLTEFVNELQSDDLLVKINAIELLNEIAATNAGVTFLEKTNLLTSISSVLDNEQDDDVVVQLVKSAVIKFFGHLGEKEDVDLASIAAKYRLLERLEKCLDSTNMEIITITISTIGLIGSHPKGLKLLSSRGPLLTRFTEIYSSSIGQVKIVSLQSLSKLLAVKEDEEIENLTMNLFNQLQGRPSTLSQLIKEAKQPDDTLRIAAFAVMQSVAYHIWGDQLMAQSNEYMDYILNRSTEYNEQGQSWKYAIIQTMSQVPNALNIFGNAYYAQIEVYLRQGAFYKTIEPVAAVQT